VLTSLILAAGKTLQEIVLSQAEKLQQKLQQVDQRFWQQVIETQPRLLQRLQRCKDMPVRLKKLQRLGSGDETGQRILAFSLTLCWR
jgi:hypothetical protein